MSRTIEGMVVAATLVVATVAAAASACGPGYQKLEVDKIQSVAVAIDEPERRFCAYAPVALRALVTYRDGKQVQSMTPGDNQRDRLRVSEFQWASTHGTVDDIAVLRLTTDVFAWLGKPIHVSARVAARPEVVGEIDLAPRFDCGGTLSIRGAEGARGGELEDGGPGAPGPVAEVALAYVDTGGGERLVLVRVTRGEDAPEHFVIDARQARKPFVIDARGGRGGRGGQGEAGAYGTPGIPGMPGLPGPEGPPGPDGPACDLATPGTDGTGGGPGGAGGMGRNGGAGGPGGRVTLRYDARFPELATLVQILVEGGPAGEGGYAGPGGSGGLGGKGGQGGKLSIGCPGSYAAAGKDGVAGPNGADGPTGARGMDGPPGLLQQAPGDVVTLFADEIARGVAVVTGGAQ
ncbi:MAG TPA: hypothetical protein VM261_18700 [Kofleriaceae bacterium]|nr:hypothetical protein [Kofleriaceae bacterium]